MNSVYFLLAALLCVASAQNCTYDWECGNIPYRVCKAGSSTPTTPSGCVALSGFALDDYPQAYYGTVCPAAGGSYDVILKRVPLTGGVPEVVYSVSIPSSDRSIVILDALFNSLYFTDSLRARSVLAGQVRNLNLADSLIRQLTIERDQGEVFVCAVKGASAGSDDSGSSSFQRKERADSSSFDSDSESFESGTTSGSFSSSTTTGGPTSVPVPTIPPFDGPFDAIDLYVGIEELLFQRSKTIYYFPAGTTCGPSRKGTGEDLFFTTATDFYRGTTDCENCPLPSPFFSASETVIDFDVSADYIFFGTESGLYRIDYDGQNLIRLGQFGAVLGVRVSDGRVYFNTEIADDVRSIAFDGSDSLSLVQQPAVATQSTCQCVSRFTGSRCTQCDGQVQWNRGVPSCVATNAFGVPESCSFDYQCGNPPFTLCSNNVCKCAHENLSGANCNRCESPRRLTWSAGKPVCL